MHSRNRNEVTKRIEQLHASAGLPPPIWVPQLEFDPLDCSHFIHGWEPQEFSVKLNGGNKCEKVSLHIKVLHDLLMAENESKLAKEFVQQYKKCWRIIQISKKSKDDFSNLLPKLENWQDWLLGKKISIKFGVFLGEMRPGKFGCISMGFNRKRQFRP